MLTEIDRRDRRIDCCDFCRISDRCLGFYRRCWPDVKDVEERCHACKQCFKFEPIEGFSTLYERMDVEAQRRLVASRRASS